MNLTRRAAVHSLAALAGLAGLSTRAGAAIPTPDAAEGPFYPSPGMRFGDVDNDLVRIAGAVRQAGGEIVHLEGRVLDRAGRPIAGARVEIWQCDANGRYLHTGDRGGADRDPAFQGFGHDITDEAGGYRFRTIRPVPYPGRTPHIHVKVQTGDRELTTQFYLKDGPMNARDFLYRRMSPAEQQAVAMEFVERDDMAVAEVDIVI